MTMIVPQYFQVFDFWLYVYCLEFPKFKLIDVWKLTYQMVKGNNEKNF